MCISTKVASNFFYEKSCHLHRDLKVLSSSKYFDQTSRVTIGVSAPRPPLTANQLDQIYMTEFAVTWILVNAPIFLIFI